MMRQKGEHPAENILQTRVSSMSAQTKLEFCARTETGRVRSHNEDSVLTSRRLGLAVVADGMGGYQAGEVASEIAVRVIAEQVAAALMPDSPAGEGTMSASASQVLHDAVQLANREILSAATAHEEYQGMGTTVVAALFRDRCLALAYVGDSRAYRWRGGELRRVTEDHSVVQEFVASGLYSEAEARARFNTNLVTRALGIDDEVEVAVTDQDITSGDIYLLCSDGLTDMVRDEQIETVLGDNTAGLTTTAEQLITLADQAGGRDNITLVLVRVAGCAGG